MNINTKFDVGERVWVVEKNKTIESSSSIITSISIEKDGSILYFFDEWGCDFTEKVMIKYNDKEALVNKIIELDGELMKEYETWRLKEDVEEL